MSLRAIAIFLAFALPGAPSLALQPGAAQYRGYALVNQIVRERMFGGSSNFELGSYIELAPLSEGSNLLDLLGTFKSGSSGDRFRNGDPNAVNLLIWHLLLAGLAKDVARVCSDDQMLFSKDFIDRVRVVCGFPEGGARSEVVLMTFWLGVMSYDAPLSEFYEWVKFVQGEEMATFRGPEAVEWLAISILNNPYFLLRQ